MKSFTVNVNIVDEDQKKAIQSYDPQAPVTRKGVLRSLRTGRPIEIREEDLVSSKKSPLSKFITLFCQIKFFCSF